MVVRSRVEGIRGAETKEYYAPGVGLILTTVPTTKGEQRITELYSHEIADINDFEYRKEMS